MTKEQWQGLPEMVRRRVVLDILGVERQALEAMTVEVYDAKDALKLPARTIAAIRPPLGNGRLGRRLYVKETLRAFVVWN